MSIFGGLRAEKPGNLEEGGNVRAPGEEEVGALEGLQLVDADEEERKKREGLNAAELKFVENTLSVLSWRAQDVLNNPSKMEDLAEKMNPGLRPNVRRFKIKEHLEELARRDRVKRFGQAK